MCNYAHVLSLWRNRLARQTVNLKVGGSSPPRDDFFCFSLCKFSPVYSPSDYTITIITLCTPVVFHVTSWLGGATVARLTPDQKVACSNHVRVIHLFYFHLYAFSFISIGHVFIYSILFMFFLPLPPPFFFLFLFTSFSFVCLKSNSDLFAGINYLAGIVC